MDFATRPSATARAALVALGSPRLTVAFFLLMAASALWTAQAGIAPTVTTALPLSLLVVNLVAAIATNPRFRRDLPLLLFHLALLAFVILLLAARLTYFDGAAILTAGTAFEGKLVKNARGPLHGDGPEALRFANQGFNERFPARGQYHTTYNRIGWQDKSGATGVAEIGDDHPLVLDGYRIYTTGRRGFSPMFRWRPTSGTDELGTVQLPDNGDNGLGPAVEWKLPDGRSAWVLLSLDEQAIPAPGSARHGLGANDINHHLVLRADEQRHELRPGDTVELVTGQLTYLKLDSWMGYRIVKDLTEPWLVATVLVGVGALLWFYARLLRPSDDIDPKENER